MLSPDRIIHPFRDDLQDDYLPKEWTPEHVERRLIEAYRCLSALPGRRIRPRQFGNFMPSYMVEWEDLLAQAENPDKDDIAPRRERPTAIQIANMDIALGWSISFLRGHQDEARALSRRCGAKALDIPLARVARRCGANERQLRRLAQRGALIVAGALNRRESVVW